MKPTEVKPVNTVVNQPFIKNNPMTREGIPYRPPQPKPPGVQPKQNDGNTAFELKIFNPPQKPEAAPYQFQPFQPHLDLKGMNKNMQYAYIPQTANIMGPQYTQPIPLQNVYNISLPSVGGGHIAAKNVVNAILPDRLLKFTYNTIGEREEMRECIRSYIAKNGDGEEISFDGESGKTLLSFITLLELARDQYSLTKTNPYDKLPFGLLIYKSAFPVRLDERSNTVHPAQGSTTLNLRMYALNISEYLSFTRAPNMCEMYDVWRELSYYTYITTKVIKTKRSPNFIMMYCYMIGSNPTLDILKIKRDTFTQKEKLTFEHRRLKGIEDEYVKNGKNIPLGMLNTNLDIVVKLPDEIDIRLQNYSSKTLVILTEAPTYSIYRWASHEFNIKGPVEEQIYNGNHSSDIWLNVLFQFMAAMHIIQKDKIYFRNMSFADNVYIKMTGSENATNYWEYVIDGITYYIPNLGCVVMIDSNYKDIIAGSQVTPSRKRRFKMYSNKIFGKRYKGIDKAIYKNFKDMINPSNSFGQKYTSNGVIGPPENVIELMNRIHNDSETDIGKLIETHFRFYMNNRIGTALRGEPEYLNVRDSTIFKKGQMVIETVNDKLSKWGILLTDVRDDGTVILGTKQNENDSDIVTKVHPANTLKSYSENAIINQDVITIHGRPFTFSKENMVDKYLV